MPCSPSRLDNKKPYHPTTHITGDGDAQSKFHVLRMDRKPTLSPSSFRERSGGYDPKKGCVFCRHVLFRVCARPYDHNHFTNNTNILRPLPSYSKRNESNKTHHTHRKLLNRFASLHNGKSFRACHLVRCSRIRQTPPHGFTPGDRGVVWGHRCGQVHVLKAHARAH